jgi:hypothetical protein
MKILFHGALVVVGSLFCTSLFKKKLVWGGLLFLGFYRFSFIFKQRSFIKTSPQLVINVPTMVTFNVIYFIFLN